MKKLFFSIICMTCLQLAFGQERAIIDNSKSPYVKLKGINVGDCHWTEGFWADKFKVLEHSMLPYMEGLLCGDIGHALNNFKIAAGLMEGKHEGTNWHDGDFYKFMEAMMYLYAQNGDERINQKLDEWIEIIGKAQEPDGYLQTQVQLKGLKRFGNRQYHEMYNAGHLFTAACIHKRVTRKDSFLKIAIKYADYLFDRFMPQPDSLKRFGFNQTQIMGLTELYRTTGNRNYLDLAKLFIDMRGRSKVQADPTVNYRNMGDMVQERTPLREEKEAVGHAVLALYFYSGAADVYAETGEKALIDALDRIWENITNKKMYITGACGQTHHGVSSHVDMIHEGFIGEYMMPNLTAYNETCANICNAMFNYRMLGIHAQAKYADVMELVLYNSALSGISIDGKEYFYANPLRVCHHAEDDADAATEFDDRRPYIECFCCPPNLVRTIAKVSAWAYSLSDNGLAVNIYGGNILDTKLADGSELKLSQKTQYPWDGKVEFTFEKCKKQPFDLMLRIPEWADNASILVNGQQADVKMERGSYVVLNRKWKKGDKVELNLPMAIKLMEGNPLIEEVRNQVAIKRGPVVYCIESPDLPQNTGILDVYLPLSSELKAEYKPQLLGGVTTISTEVKIRKDSSNAMYHSLEKPQWETVQTQFVPYFSWANRGSAEMTVWVPIMWE